MRRQSEKYMIIPIKALNFTMKIKIVLQTYLFINLRDINIFLMVLILKVSDNNVQVHYLF